MELRDIEYFGVIAEHKHLGRAAEALGLSVPAMSKSLRRLEAAAEAKLVTRTPKGIELTAEGAALLSHARALRVSLRDITRQLADLRRGRAGDVHVGAGPGFAEYLLPPACAALEQDGAKVMVSVIVAIRAVLLPALLQGELDLAVVESPPPDAAHLAHEHLYDNHVGVCAALDHPLATQGALHLRDLVGHRWVVTSPRVQQQLCEIFEQRGLPTPEFALVTNSSWMRVRAVASSRLLGIHSVPTYPEAQTRLAILPIEDLAWTRSVSVVYRSAAYLSPAARRLIEILKITAAGRDRPAAIP